MARLTTYADLKERIVFQKRVEADDGYGNTVAGWQDLFSVAAELIGELGRESIEGGALVGIQRWTIRVRDFAQTEQVTPEWRAYNKREPSLIFNIRSNVALVDVPGFRHMVAETGVAT